MFKFKARNTERPWSVVSKSIYAGALLAVVVQFGFHWFSTRHVGQSFEPLSHPMPSSNYKALFLGSTKLWGYLMILNLQLHDNQSGRHLSYRHLDYEVLSRWLLLIQELNSDSGYPGFLASRVYSQNVRPDQLKEMINVVRVLFQRDPERHWQRMTEASLLAKYQLNDMSLALELAEPVFYLSKTMKLPAWARDMKIILLDDMNEDEAAALLIASMLESREVMDPDERRFLESRLLKIQQELLKSGNGTRN